jgi:hypothetical protein
MDPVRFGIAMIISLVLSFFVGYFINLAVADVVAQILLGGFCGYAITTLVLNLICE